MTQPYLSEIVLKNTAEAVIVPLKAGILSLNKVYRALITADVDPVTGQCYKSHYIRKKIVQAHQQLQRSEQAASSELKSLDESLERLMKDEGKLEREKRSTETQLENLMTEQASNEKLYRDSQEALEQARANLTSAKQKLQDQESRKYTAEVITGVGAGLMIIPVIGWIAGISMMIGGGIAIKQSKRAVQEAEEEVRKADDDVKRYENKVSENKSKVSQTRCDIKEKDDNLRKMREEIQKLRKQRETVAVFQQKVRGAVHLLGVLSARTSVAKNQARKSILQEPMMKVMEDVMKAIEKIAGNELLCESDMPRLIDQMKRNSQRLAAICASEISFKNKTRMFIDYILNILCCCVNLRVRMLHK